MTINALKRAPLLLAAILVAGVTSQAHADPQAYANSYDNIYNGQIQFRDTNGALIAPNSGLIVQNPSPNTGASSTLNGSGGPNGSCSGLLDCSGLGYAVSGVPPGPITNNAFIPFGQAASVGFNYGWGDSHIVSEQSGFNAPCTGGSNGVRGTNCFQGVNEGESSVSAGNSATGNGNLGSGTGFVVFFSVSTGAVQVDISLDATPYLKTFLDAASGGSPDQARASLTATATIIDTSTGNIVFSWAPNGTFTGAFGGTILADPFSLNRTLLSSLPAGLGNGIYNPCLGAEPTGESPIVCGVNPFFHVLTNALGPGIYELDLTMTENTNVQRSPVPEPTSIALLGVALAGLGLARRRKNGSRAA